jgi:FkbM family methyltransferase
MCRGYLFDLLGAVSPDVAVESGGMRYLVSTSDKEVSRTTFMWGNFAQDQLALAVQLLEARTPKRLKGMEFVDIGANIGTTAIPAVKLFGASHVWAFEPAPENLRLLRCNVIANDVVESVTVLPVALSNNSGTAALELSTDNWGDHRVAVSQEDGSFHEAERAHITVEIARFDDVVRDHAIDVDRLGLIWMDTQGHEGRILAGAQCLLQSDVPVLTEYWPYGLRRSSCLDQFHQLVVNNYSTMIDLRADDPIEYPIGAVADLEGIYTGLSGTDLLLI